jgi:hypothetical protein
MLRDREGRSNEAIYSHKNGETYNLAHKFMGLCNETDSISGETIPGRDLDGDDSDDIALFFVVDVVLELSKSRESMKRIKVEVVGGRVVVCVFEVITHKWVGTALTDLPSTQSTVCLDLTSVLLSPPGDHSQRCHHRLQIHSMTCSLPHHSTPTPSSLRGASPVGMIRSRL